MLGNKGFTLIELLAVTAIIVIVSGLIVGVLYSTLRGGNKSKVTNDVAQNGNYALSVVSQAVILAESVVAMNDELIEDCSVPITASSIEFKQANGESMRFACEEDSIIQTIGQNAPIHLMDKNSVKVTYEPNNPASCSFTCEQTNGNSYSQPIIRIGFTVSQKSSTNLFDSIATSAFNTSVTMRNYSPK